MDASHYTVDFVISYICAFSSVECVMFLMYSPFIGPNTCLNQSLDVYKYYTLSFSYTLLSSFKSKCFQ